MRVRALPALVGVLLVIASSPMLAAARGGAPASEPTATSAVRQAYLSLERVIEASDVGLKRPEGITFVRESSALLVTGTRSDGTAGLQTVSPGERLAESVMLPAGLSSTADVAFDSTRDRLVAATDAGSLLAVPAPAGNVAPDAAAAESAVQGQGAAAIPSGIDVNPAGETLVLGSDGGVRITRVATPASSIVNRVVTLAGAGEELRGLAVAPDGHLFSVGTGSRTLFEFDADGVLLATRDLASLGIDSPQDIAIAPSGDTSDAPTDTSLYLADAGTTAGTGAAIVELTLVEPALSPLVAAAAVSSVDLVNTFNTGSQSTWSPDSPDPSGLAYIAASETEVPSIRRDRLVAGDGEVDETTGAGFHDVNVWFAPRNGAVQTATFNTNEAPTNPVNNEPVGVAYDSVRNEL